MRPLAAFALTAAMLWAGLPAHAADAPMVRVEHAWIRLLPGTLPAGGYATLRNTGAAPVVLTGASSDDYQHIMLHRSTTHGGVSHMSQVDKLTVPAHATVTLTPGSYHLMLMHATRAIDVGDMVPVTLHFADGKTLTVDFKARPANAH